MNGEGYKDEIIAICMPAQDTHPMKFTLALAMQLFELGRDGYTKILVIPGHSSVGAFRARNRIMKIISEVERERGWKVDWTFWVDSDMLFPSRAYQALRGHNKEIVGATYRRRSEPFELLGRPLEGTSGKVTIGNLAPSARLPTGLMLIKRSVFDRFKMPVWKVELGEDGVEDVLGEDGLFCAEALELGHEIWLDTQLTMLCKHIAVTELAAEADKAPQPQIIMPPGLIAA